jgi:arsenate reductase-like glutaredoxin family protein
MLGGLPRNPNVIKNVIVDDNLFRQFGTHPQLYTYLSTQLPKKHLKNIFKTHHIGTFRNNSSGERAQALIASHIGIY